MDNKITDESIFICRNDDCNNIHEDETYICELCGNDDIEEVLKNELDY